MNGENNSRSGANGGDVVVLVIEVLIDDFDFLIPDPDIGLIKAFPFGLDWVTVSLSGIA